MGDQKHDRPWRRRNPEKQAGYEKAYRDRNPEKISAKNRKNRDKRGKEYWREYDRKNPAKVMRNNARSRAKRQGVEFSITEEWIVERMKPMICEVTGVELSFDYETQRRHPWTPSLDRIDPKEGYTVTNTRVVCWAYNQAKGDWDDQVVAAWASKAFKWMN